MICYWDFIVSFVYECFMALLHCYKLVLQDIFGLLFCLVSSPLHLKKIRIDLGTYSKYY